MAYLTKELIIDAFRKCGIQPGSVLMLHPDAIFLAQTRPMSKENRYALFFEALDEFLGQDGTLVIPTFTYSATKNEPFIVEETQSTVGGLSEYFRKIPGVLRSRDPNFSVAVRGKKSEEFANTEVKDAFGPTSIFGLLDRYNAWIACLACSFDRITYTHYVEQIFGVDYRYIKKFPYTIIENGNTNSGIVKYYVRDLKRNSAIHLYPLQKILSQKSHLINETIGRFQILAVKCHYFKTEAINLLSNNKKALILEGSKI